MAEAPGETPANPQPRDPIIVTDIVADNVKIIANNIQAKIGQMFLGAQKAADTAKGSEPVVKALKKVADLQKKTGEQVTLVWEVLKAQLDFEKEEARRARQEAKELMMEQKRLRGPGSGLVGASGAGGAAGLGGKGKGGPGKGGAFDEDAMVGYGVAGIAGLIGSMIPKLVKRMARLIFNRITMAISGVVYAILDGFTAKEAWGEAYGDVPAFIGGLLGGADDKLKGAFKGALKWVGPFALAGSFIPIIGTWIGAMIGLVVGALAGWIGGENIAKGVQQLSEMTLEELWKPITDFYNNVKLKMIGVYDVSVEKIKSLASAIFDPIIIGLKKISNAMKSALNWLIEQANKIPGIKMELWEMTPITDEEIKKDQEKKNVEKSKELAKKSKEEGAEQISVDDVAETLANANTALATMQEADFKEKGMGESDVEQIRAHARALLAMAESGKVTDTQAEALRAKAQELLETLSALATELEQEAISTGGPELDTVPEHIKEIAKPKKEIMEQELELKKVLEDEEKKIDAKIVELEKKDEDEQGKAKSRAGAGTKAHLLRKKKELEAQQKDIERYEEGEKTIYEIELEKAKTEITPAIEEEVKKSITSQRKRAGFGKRRLEIEKEKEKIEINNVNGPPTTINTSKNITAIPTSGVFPVDQSLMASLNGYTNRTG